MTTASRRNVALVRAGTWSASTGVTKINRDDLAAMVTAYTDHVVDRPVIKLGHDDDNALNREAGVTGDTGFGDGEPAFGWLANLSLGDGSTDRPDPDTLYGDYVGMPAKLADVSDTAWRRRSVEIAWGVKTAAGKAYRAVLTGVALLGVRKPAVKGLADVLALYSGLDDADSVTAFEVVEGVEDPAALAWLAAARTEVTQLAEAHELPAAAVDAALERLDRLAGVRDTGSVPHSPADRSEGDAVPAATAATDTTMEGTRMPLTKADVQKALEQAGDEDVTALLGDLLKTPAAPAAETAATGTETPAAGVETPALVATAASAPAQATAATPAATPEVVTLTRSAFEELQAGAQAGTAANEAIARTRREGILATALSEGRITVTERGKFAHELTDGETATGWAAALERDEQGTTSLLSGLTPRFPTTELGHAVQPATTELSEPEQAAVDEFVGSLGIG